MQLGAAMSSLYDRYGGFKTVSKIVMVFYDMALDSDQIGDYFEDVDMARLIDHQTKFIASVMGGPASFSDDRLRKVHSHLGICHEDMDEMEQLLKQALVQFKVTEADIETIISGIESKRPLIVTEVTAS
ncbi:group I truncated hemoglobin [Ruegeria marina]|uniref:Hemoglobin n=1 Tax=Ruegeria marina TaxID=639004 RepID=A0A1G6VRX3_9RHOB|nr:group 1 truncated hemoglobin [Ruegeria marina]SDD56294.1 hemoglobin [Ruegeria marina]